MKTRKKKSKTSKSNEALDILRESADIVRSFMERTPEQLEADMAFAFPEADPGIRPVGNRIVVQIRRPKKKSDGGIEIPEETRDAEKWNEMTGKVIAMGPLCYKNRQEPDKDWPEGPWCQVGDYIRVPKFGGDRIERPVKGEREFALFVTVEDKNVLSVVTCCPLDLKTLI